MDWCTHFKKGDRVKLSREAVSRGLHRWTKQQDRIGTVINARLYVRVQWDGNSSCGDAYHPNYLQHVDSEPV